MNISILDENLEQNLSMNVELSSLRKQSDEIDLKIFQTKQDITELRNHLIMIETRLSAIEDTLIHIPKLKQDYDGLKRDVEMLIKQTFELQHKSFIGKIKSLFKHT